MPSDWYFQKIMDLLKIWGTWIRDDGFDQDGGPINVEERLSWPYMQEVPLPDIATPFLEKPRRISLPQICLAFHKIWVHPWGVIPPVITICHKNHGGGRWRVLVYPGCEGIYPTGDLPYILQACGFQSLGKETAFTLMSDSALGRVDKTHMLEQWRLYQKNLWKRLAWKAQPYSSVSPGRYTPRP